MDGLDIVVALLVLVGVAGTIIPLLPGVLLVGASVGVWAAVHSSWWLLALAVVLTSIAVVAKFLLPARAARERASSWALAVGAVAGVVGLFVIPVVGLPVGFVAGVLVAELVRVQRWDPAWAATWATLKSVTVSMAVELAMAAMMTAAWVATLIVQ